MKKRIAVLLCLVMVFSMCLCACSNEKDAILGSWKGSMDMADIVNNETAAGDPEMAEYMKLDKFELAFIMTFNEDDTFSMVVDEAALETEVDAVADKMVAGMMEYMVAMLAEQGLEMTAEEVMAMSGLTVEDLKAEFLASIDLDEMFGEVNTYGKFKVKDGRLYTSDSVDAEADPLVYELYTIEGNSLTIDKGNGMDSDGDFAYPMTFQKIG